MKILRLGTWRPGCVGADQGYVFGEGGDLKSYEEVYLSTAEPHFDVKKRGDDWGIKVVDVMTQLVQDQELLVKVLKDLGFSIDVAAEGSEPRRA